MNNSQEIKTELNNSQEIKTELNNSQLNNSQ